MSDPKRLLENLDTLSSEEVAALRAGVRMVPPAGLADTVWSALPPIGAGSGLGSPSEASAPVSPLPGAPAPSLSPGLSGSALPGTSVCAAPSAATAPAGAAATAAATTAGGAAGAAAGAAKTAMLFGIWKFFVAGAIGGATVVAGWESFDEFGTTGAQPSSAPQAAIRPASRIPGLGAHVIQAPPPISEPAGVVMPPTSVVPLISEAAGVVTLPASDRPSAPSAPAASFAADPSDMGGAAGPRGSDRPSAPSAPAASTGSDPRAAPGISAELKAPDPSRALTAPAVPSVQNSDPNLPLGSPSRQRTTDNESRVHASARAEVDLVQSARNALHYGDPLRALADLHRADIEFPTGILGQEREVLTIEALAALGRKRDAAVRAQSYLAAHPDSPFVSRVRRISSQ